MPPDDRLREGLQAIANEVEPDVERAMARALAARPRGPIRRAGTLFAYVAAVGLAIVAVGLATSSLLDRDRVGSSSPPSADAGSADPTASANRCPRPEGGSCVGGVGPGQHRSLEFIPPLDYRIPDDATVAWDNPEDLPGTFTLHPAGPVTDAIFVFRDVRVLTEGCDPHLDESVGNTAAEIAAWITANSGITSTPVEPATLGGLRGVLLDIAASGTYTTVCPNDEATYPGGTPILPLFAGAGSGNLTWFIGGDERMRLYLLDMPGGGNIVISIDTIGGDFEALLEVSQPVLDSIIFDESYY
jgi:hypothetical protein